MAVVISRDTYLTTHEVGALLQVNPSSVANWVKAGRIRAFRTPGGHHRIRAQDLVNFLTEYQMPIPRELEPAFKRRVLFVDDDPRQLTAFKRSVKPLRDRVDAAVADNGIDALILVGSFKPDIVVLDVFMPHVDGLELLKRLKSNPETKHIDIVVQSGKLNPELVRDAMESGARVCLHKPIKMKSLFEEIGVETTAPPPRI